MSFRFTKLSFHRPLASYAKVQQLIGAVIRNQSAQARRFSASNPTWLNLGCGDHLQPGFINIDYHWIPGLDLCWDLAHPLPFTADSVDGAFSEHCLEHLQLSTARSLLADLFRVLKPGSVLRLTVPDAGAFLLAYARWVQKGPCLFPPPYQGDPSSSDWSPIFAVNSVFRDHGHHFAYDFEGLRMLLAQQGFQDIRRCSFREGRQPQLLLDHPARQHESLFVEAVK